MNWGTLPANNTYIYTHTYIHTYAAYRVYCVMFNLKYFCESLQSGLENQMWGLKRFDGTNSHRSVSSHRFFVWLKQYRVAVMFYHEAVRNMSNT